MICKTGRHPSEMMAELTEKFGKYVMKECNIAFPPEKKAELQSDILTRRLMPDFGFAPARVSYEDGCKVYFADDSFVVCRFSGTEPLLRIFAEGHSDAQPLGYIAAWKSLLGL